MAEHDHDLHELLDSALDGFTKVEQKAAHASSSRDQNSVAEKQATATSSSSANSKPQTSTGKQSVQGLGSGVSLPQKKGKASGKKAVQSGGASSSRSDATGSGATGARRTPPGSEAGRTVEALHEQTRQTVEGMDPGLENLDLMAQLQQMAGGGDVQSLMDNMMKQLLSKDVLYEPMKEIGRRLLHVYENDSDNFEQVTALMQEMQECGHPPDEIIQELAPGVDFGEDGMPSLPDLLGATQGAGGPGGQDCCVM